MIQHGFPNRLECSSRGDPRFSAFYATVNGKTIEQQYQAFKMFADGSTGLSIKEAKGKYAINQEACAELYSKLWDQYFSENPHLLKVIKQYRGFSDMFGQPGHVCQATEIYRIWINEEVKKCIQNMHNFAHLIVNKHHQETYDVLCTRQTKWGNSYSHMAGSTAKFAVASREEAVVQHRLQFIEDMRSGAINLDELATLADRRLGCVCKPQLCHTATIAAAAHWAKYQRQT